MALVIQQPGTPGRFCLYDDDARRFLATDQTADGVRAIMVPRLVALGLTQHGAVSRVGVLLTQATRLADAGPACDPLWQMAKVGPRSATGAGDIAWMAKVESEAPHPDAGQPATPAAPRGVRVVLGWLVARDYPKGDATVREYLGLRTAPDLLDLHGLWGEQADAVRLPQHQARAIVRGLRRQGEDVRVVRLWRWVATG